MASFFSFLLNKRFPDKRERPALARGPLTPSKALFWLSGLALLVVAYVFLTRFNDSVLVTVPARGGSITEGVIGAPRFINPLLATTETDAALTRLVYAGLFKELPDGTVAPELAERYEVSPNGQIYTFHLRKKIHFHDGSLLTASDVAFTFEKLADESLNLRTAGFWRELSVETPDQSTVVVTATAPQEELFRALTVGILPLHRFEGVVSEAYVDPSLSLYRPVGAGGFKVSSVVTDDDGAVRRIELVRNRGYALGAPLLSSLSVAVYANQASLADALSDGAIDATFGLEPSALAALSLSSSVILEPAATETIVALFASAHEPLLQGAAGATIDRFIDKARIVATVENGYGLPAADAPAATLEETLASLKASGYGYADGILTRGGTPVTLAIATENDPSLIATGRAVAGQLAALGIQAQVQAFDQGTFQDGVSQSAYPAVLATAEAMRGSSGYQERVALYTEAILLASRGNIHGALPALLAAPTLRYGEVSDWHARYDRVWPFLVTEQAED